ncbi:hypothetical protein FRC12_003491 [Ceratobasidium sp. 428]|nr:hypothetical protein FRC12_003491 [Ceratobasidium sp. 428]
MPPPPTPRLNRGYARYALVYSSIPRLDSAEYKWPKSLIATAHALVLGCLLETRGCHGNQSDLSADICKECLDDLQQPTALPPKHSLANNTWVGEVHWQLERLTFAEHLLIARIYPRMFLIKLFPRERSQRNLPRDQVQTGLRGNVVSFELNSAAIADMLSGNLMPQKPDILASTLSVTFVGRGQIRDPSTLNMLRVRRDAIFDALTWLKTHNQKYYGDIVIDQDRLNALPPDSGVPDAIKAGIRHETNELMVNDEYRGYVPETYYSDNVDIEGVSRAEGNPEEDLDDGPDVIPLQCLGVMDNDLSQVSPDEFMQWGLHNMQRRAEGSQAECGYAVRHGAAPTPVDLTFGLLRSPYCILTVLGASKMTVQSEYRSMTMQDGRSNITIVASDTTIHLYSAYLANSRSAKVYCRLKSK